MKKDKTSIIILAVLVVIAVIAYFILGGNIGSNYDKLKTLVVSTTSGRKVQTEYASIEGNDFFVKVPTEFKEMSFDNKAAKYPDHIPPKVYTDENNIVTVTLDLTKEKISNDEIVNYKNKRAEYFKENATLKDAKIFKTDGHNIARIEYMEKDMYYQVIYFSYSGYLGIVTFSCSMDALGEWAPVGNFVIESIYFE